MFKIIKLEDTLRIPPELYGRSVKDAIRSLLEEKYEGMVFEDLGFVLSILDFSFNPKGKVMPGDGGSYHKVTFTVLSFMPEVQEVTLGKVTEVEEYGAFVRIGPFEALLHVSSIIDDFVDFNKSQGILVGRKTRRVLSSGDWVRVRVTAVSIGGAGGDKIGVMSRQPFLGKEEWIQEDIKKLAAEAKASEQK